MNALIARLGAHFELSDHNRRLPSMEGLRGLAILLVFACHYYGIIGEQLRLPRDYVTLSTGLALAAASGVDLFFLLSGFLIYRSALRHNLNYLSFMKRRFERIYPTFIVVLIIYLLLMKLHFTPSRVPAGLADGARYVIANLLFFPGMFDIQAIISAAWSLSYEWTFYLAIPLIVHLFQMHRWSRASRIAFFLGLAAVWIGVSLAFGHVDPIAWFAARVRLMMFVAGILVWEALDSARIRAALSRSVEYVLAGVFAVCTVSIVIVCIARAHPAVDGEWTAMTGTLQIVPTFIGCAALGLIVLNPAGLLAKAFSVNWLRWTGNFSYSFYLVHSIPMHVIGVLVNHPPLRSMNPIFVYALVFPLTIALVYACTIVLFLTIERPLSLRPRTAKKLPSAQPVVA